MTTYTYQTIDVPGSAYTSVVSINASGEIFGYYGDSINVQYGFLYNNGIYTTINIPGVVAINSGGQIIGFNGTTGFVYSKGTYTTIDVPGSNITDPISINKAGQIVGDERPATESRIAANMAFSTAMALTRRSFPTLFLAKSRPSMMLAKWVGITKRICPTVYVALSTAMALTQQSYRQVPSTAK
jgi:hypothetical protein